jgi:hypothetical protein
MQQETNENYENRRPHPTSVRKKTKKSGSDFMIAAGLHGQAVNAE